MKPKGALSWIPHIGVNEDLCILGRYVLSKFLRSRVPPYLEWMNWKNDCFLPTLPNIPEDIKFIILYW